MMMSDEQEFQDPSFQRQTVLLIHLNTCPPHGWHQPYAILSSARMALAGGVVVVVEAPRASITKPHDQAFPTSGCARTARDQGVTNS